MDQDGITDIGLYVPDGSGATGTPGSEWYWLVSGGVAPTPGTASVIAYNHKFSEAPLGNDIYAKFGNTYAMPVVGNFDPPSSVQSNAPATPAFAVVGPTSGTYQAGQTVGIQWTAANVVTGSKISLCFDTDTTFNKNEHWIEIDAVAAANSGGTYTWNTTGVAPGTYYLGGYMYDGSSFTMSHLTQAITITGAAAKAPQTFALTGPTSGAYQAGQTVNIQWTAGNVVAGSKISLCYDADTAFNGNEHWIEIDAVAAANGNGSYTWNTTNVPTGTYYIAGYMFDGNKTFTMSHLGLAINITSPSKATQTTSAASAPQTFALTGPTSGAYQAGKRSTSSGRPATSRPAARSASATTATPPSTATNTGSKSTPCRPPTAAVPTPGIRPAWRPARTTLPATCTTATKRSPCRTSARQLPSPVRRRPSP